MGPGTVRQADTVHRLVPTFTLVLDHVANFVAVLAGVYGCITDSSRCRAADGRR